MSLRAAASKRCQARDGNKSNKQGPCIPSRMAAHFRGVFPLRWGSCSHSTNRHQQKLQAAENNKIRTSVDNRAVYTSNYFSSRCSRHVQPSSRYVPSCVVCVIVEVMRLPRAAWAWSAFQVDTALFMYGGVPTVAISAEAIHKQRPPKRKATEAPQESPRASKRQSLRRSLSSTTELKRSLSKLL